MIAGSLSLREIVEAQGGYWFGFIPKWFIFLQPVGFVIYMIAGVAETNRAPFDFPEAEQELVAGLPHRIQQHGVRDVLPRGVHQHRHRVGRGDEPVPRRLADAVHPGTRRAVLAGPGRAADAASGSSSRSAPICFFYIWMRWTLPRLRYDQLMQFGWKVLLPLAALNLLVTAAGVIYFG